MHLYRVVAVMPVKQAKQREIQGQSLPPPDTQRRNGEDENSMLKTIDQINGPEQNKMKM